jgi:hypothetical protein
VMGSEAGREDGSEARRGDKARPPLVGGSKGEGARLEGGIACVLTEGTRNHYVGLTRPPYPGDTRITTGGRRGRLDMTL